MVHVPLDCATSHRDLRQLLHVHLSAIRSVLSNLMHCLLSTTCSRTAVPVSFIISVNIIFVLISAMGSKVAVRSVVLVFGNQRYFLVRWIHLFLDSGDATKVASFSSHPMKVWARGDVDTIHCVWLRRALRRERRRVLRVSFVRRRSFDIWLDEKGKR